MSNDKFLGLKKVNAATERETNGVGSESQLNDLLSCPFCKSNDVGYVTRLGTTYFDCYGCDARVHFTKVGLHVSEQLMRFKARPDICIDNFKLPVDVEIKGGIFRKGVQVKLIINRLLREFKYIANER